MNNISIFGIVLFTFHQINSFFIPFGAAHPHQKEGWVAKKGIKNFLLVGPLSKKIIMFFTYKIHVQKLSNPLSVSWNSLLFPFGNLEYLTQAQHSDVQGDQ